MMVKWPTSFGHILQSAVFSVVFVLLIGAHSQNIVSNRTRLYAVPSGNRNISVTAQPYTERNTTQHHHQQHKQQHPCLRECVEGAPHMTCRFTFNLEYYYTMSKACYNCPHNTTDCDRPDCIMTDGFKRAVVVINRQIPGPSVEVCLGDHVVIDLVNHLSDASTSVHWHGHHQRGTPYMDGVPYVTQCPIQPRTSFRYRYVASTPGTHFWHSHTGCQRADGMFGSMVIRVPRSRDPHGHLYDYDLPQHTVTLIDWGHEMSIEKFLKHHHAGGDNKPLTLLVNGRGQFHEKMADQENKMAPHAFVANFTVKQGSRFRFRLINAGVLNCPIQMSVDNHTLLIIASDGVDFQPVEADSLVSYAGERFDIILRANQEVANYWIRLRGLMDCDERFTSAHQVAVLHYEGAGDDAPEGEVSYEAGRREGLTVNPLNAGMNTSDALLMPELNATAEDDDSLKPVADIVYYLSYDFYPLDNPVFHRAPLYGFHQVNSNRRIFTPQFNYITMDLPRAPPLSQPEDLNPATICNSSTVGNCSGRFCECLHMLQVPLHSVVELVIIDKGVTYDANHPFHLHGNAFRVVAMDRLGSNTTVEAVKQLDSDGLLVRKLHRAPIKDTVTVPDGGYTVIRFIANNPGVWLFHCHIEFHSEIGMALALQVGQPSDWPPAPHGFPKCGNFLPPYDDNLVEIEVIHLDNSLGLINNVGPTLPQSILYTSAIPHNNTNSANSPANTVNGFTLAWCLIFLQWH